MSLLAGTPRLAGTHLTALGTYVQLVLTDGAVVDEARRILVDELDALDRACSRFRADAEIARVERADGAAVEVSALLADAVEVALRGAVLTGGDLDPTVGSAVSAIGYDRDFASVPPDGPRVRVVDTTPARWTDVRLDPVQRTLSIPRGVRLDLGATAKAFAADRAADRIFAAAGCGVLVNLGGDIAIAGPAPAGGWSVRVQDEVTDVAAAPSGSSAVVSLTGGGLATSSTAARRWRRGGSALHHIVDPRTGTSAVSPWRTVSVAAATCVDANIASTASIIRGTKALGWLAQLRLPARLVEESGAVHTIGAWPAEAPA